MEKNNFCKQYHNRDKSQGQLIQTKIDILPKRDGNCTDMVNELIREGWELVYIKDIKSDLFPETFEFVFNRWIA